MGISTDFPAAQAEWGTKLGLGFPLVSDFGRKTLEAYDILDTDPKSRLFRYAKRAYVIIDKTGIVRYMKVVERDLLPNDELLAELDKLAK